MHGLKGWNGTGPATTHKKRENFAAGSNKL